MTSTYPHASMNTQTGYKQWRQLLEKKLEDGSEHLILQIDITVW
jgi:hypothetical protein